MWKSVSAVAMAAGFAGGIVALIVIAADKATDRSGYSAPASPVQLPQTVGRGGAREPQPGWLVTARERGKDAGCKAKYPFGSDKGDVCFNMAGETAEIDPGTPEIPAKAFYNNEHITGVVIPDKVLKIGDRAFYNTPLENVTIGSKVHTIGDSAFAVTKLPAVTVPDSVLKIGGAAFSNTLLKTVSIGNKVESIGKEAFYNTQLAAVTIPNSVLKIGADAFEDTPLKTVTIGNKVHTIGIGAFHETDLTKVCLPEHCKAPGAFPRSVKVEKVPDCSL